MPRNMAPANISSRPDLVEYRVSDASPIDPAAPAGYIERYIHSEIYKRFPGVNSVIHSHANEVVPYSISRTVPSWPFTPNVVAELICILDVPLRPCLHMAGFLGPSTPVYDISEHYQGDNVRDILIRDAALGHSLAACFAGPESSASSEPHHAVSLMRGHGYTVVAPTLEECIFRAIYTKVNAIILTTSLGLSAAFHGAGGGSGHGIEYVRDDELVGTKAISQTAWARAWGLWLREVEASQLYVCEM
jgi:ribulose-5-phosphate 4-epimerase/fuculose-1-phosphate aldolase